MLNGQKTIATLFDYAEIQLNGPNPWDPKIHNNRFYTRIVAQGSLGLGESYMDGDWDCVSLDQFFDRVISRHLSDRLALTVPLALLHLKARIQNRQNLRLAKQTVATHYDLPVEIFEATFDTRLTGSCAYWKDTTSLDDAQTAKLDLVCRKIGLTRGARVLDIGCGWGAFMGYAAEQYGAGIRRGYDFICPGGVCAQAICGALRRPQAHRLSTLRRTEGGSCRFDGHVRTCRFEKPPHLFQARSQLY